MTCGFCDEAGMEEKAKLASKARMEKNPEYWERLADWFETAIEEERVPPHIIDRIRERIDSIREQAEKIKRHIERVTGYVWDDRVHWFRDPVTGRFVRLKLEDYIEW